MWHDGEYPESKTATLVTRKHVVLSTHWYNDKNNAHYTFCDTNGQVCVRGLLQSDWISDDLRLGRLDTPLPDSFTPASVMSTNFVNYLFTGRYLPTLCVNQEKCVTVLELEGLGVEAVDNYGSHYVQYGMNSYTNVVSSQRAAVRGVTPGGNSSSPVFVVAGDCMILLFAKHLGSWTEDTWSSFWGPMLSFHLDAIQEKINTWEGNDAGQYQIVPIDLSPFDGVTNP